MRKSWSSMCSCVMHSRGSCAPRVSTAKQTQRTWQPATCLLRAGGWRVRLRLALEALAGAVKVVVPVLPEHVARNAPRKAPVLRHRWPRVSARACRRATAGVRVRNECRRWAVCGGRHRLLATCLNVDHARRLQRALGERTRSSGLRNSDAAKVIESSTPLAVSTRWHSASTVPTRARTSGDGFHGSLLSTCRRKGQCERCQNM
jgi:hypothetical protein